MLEDGSTVARACIWLFIRLAPGRNPSGPPSTLSRGPSSLRGGGTGPGAHVNFPRAAWGTALAPLSSRAHLRVRFNKSSASTKTITAATGQRGDCSITRRSITAAQRASEAGGNKGEGGCRCSSQAAIKQSSCCRARRDQTSVTWSRFCAQSDTFHIHLAQTNMDRHTRTDKQAHTHARIHAHIHIHILFS